MLNPLPAGADKAAAVEHFRELRDTLDEVVEAAAASARAALAVALEDSEAMFGVKVTPADLDSDRPALHALETLH